MEDEGDGEGGTCTSLCVLAHLECIQTLCKHFCRDQSYASLTEEVHDTHIYIYKYICSGNSVYIFLLRGTKSVYMLTM